MAVSQFSKYGVIQNDMNKTFDSVHIKCHEMFRQPIDNDSPITIYDSFLVICGVILLVLGLIAYIIACARIADLSD